MKKLITILIWITALSIIAVIVFVLLSVKREDLIGGASTAYKSVQVN